MKVRAILFNVNNFKVNFLEPPCLTISVNAVVFLFHPKKNYFRGGICDEISRKVNTWAGKK